MRSRAWSYDQDILCLSLLDHESLIGKKLHAWLCACVHVRLYLRSTCTMRFFMVLCKSEINTTLFREAFTWYKVNKRAIRKWWSYWQWAALFYTRMNRFGRTINQSAFTDSAKEACQVPCPVARLCLKIGSHLGSCFSTFHHSTMSYDRQLGWASACCPIRH